MALLRSGLSLCIGTHWASAGTNKLSFSPNVLVSRLLVHSSHSSCNNPSLQPSRCLHWCRMEKRKSVFTSPTHTADWWTKITCVCFKPTNLDMICCVAIDNQNNYQPKNIPGEDSNKYLHTSLKSSMPINFHNLQIC